jgi:hypothetical protein
VEKKGGEGKGEGETTCGGREKRCVTKRRVWRGGRKSGAEGSHLKHTAPTEDAIVAGGLAKRHDAEAAHKRRRSGSRRPEHELSGQMEGLLVAVQHPTVLLQAGVRGEVEA